MLAMSLIHFNEFKASYEHFADLQKVHYFNARNWTNLGTTFLCKVLFRSSLEQAESMSQINSRSIYNSNRSHISKSKNKEDEEEVKPSKLRFLKSGTKAEKSDVLLADISRSFDYVDFAIEKDNQDQIKLAVSCLKRYSLCGCFQNSIPRK
jgi:hypothetical protein